MATGLSEIMMDSSPLSQACIKALTDRMEEKRKLAASEIEKMTVEFSMSQNITMINRLINVLGRKFCLSPVPNIRKGGLLGLAAVIVGFKNGSTAELELKTVEEVILPILTCFLDSDAQVRYYACESLFNVTKVAKEKVLHFFDHIFDNMAKIIADPEPNVRDATNLVNRLLKDIVMEQESFNIEPFAPRLEEYIYTKNQHTRMFIISWIRLLDSKVDMIKFLPLLLDGIFNCLYDSTEPIKATTLSLLAEFLNKIALKPSDEVNVSSIVSTLLKHAKNNNEDLVQSTAISWLKQMIALMDEDDLVNFTPGILSAILPCLAVDSTSVVDNALSILEDIVYSTVDDEQQVNIISRPDDSLKPAFKREDTVDDNPKPNDLSKTQPSNLKKSKKVAIDSSESPQPSEETITENPNIYLIIESLTRMFLQNELIFYEKGTFIILKLCSILKPEIVYKTFAVIIVDEKLDTKFRCKLVQKLNQILLASQPLFELRRRLGTPDDDTEMVSLFNNLYFAWCYSSIDTLTLCLLTKNYRLANEIVVSMSLIGDGNSETIDQLGWAVEMLESPAFIPLRMHLLDVGSNQYLLQSLYGLLMILPQAEAYTKLANRLDQVCKFVSAQPYLKAPLPSHHHQPSPSTTSSVNTSSGGQQSSSAIKSLSQQRTITKSLSSSRETKKGSPMSIESLMRHFTSIQERVVRETTDSHQ